MNGSVRIGSVRIGSELSFYLMNEMVYHRMSIEHRTTCGWREKEKSRNEPKWNHHDSNESCKSSAMKLIPTKSIAHAHPFWIRITYHHNIFGSEFKGHQRNAQIYRQTKNKSIITIQARDFLPLLYCWFFVVVPKRKPISVIAIDT